MYEQSIKTCAFFQGNIFLGKNGLNQILRELFKSGQYLHFAKNALVLNASSVLDESGWTVYLCTYGIFLLV